MFRGLEANRDRCAVTRSKNRVQPAPSQKRHQKADEATAKDIRQLNSQQRLLPGLEDLFLGLSPATISDRHYARLPEQLLAEAIDWLGKQYGVVAEQHPG